MDPDRRRDRSEEVELGLEVVLELAPNPLSAADAERGLNGLVDGVGRELLGARCCGGLGPFKTPAGGKREGTVPARALREEL